MNSSTENLVPGRRHASDNGNGGRGPAVHKPVQRSGGGVSGGGGGDYRSKAVAGIATESGHSFTKTEVKPYVGGGGARGGGGSSSSNGVSAVAKSHVGRGSGGGGAGAACVRFLKSCSSTAGFMAAVIIWLTMGAFIFQYLEYENETADCRNQLGDYSTAEWSSHQLLMDLVYDVMERPINSSAALGELEQRVRSTLRAFSSSVVGTKYAYGRNCSLIGTEGGPKRVWTLGAAFFFCTTVVTTIGYGNIAPKTIWGRMVCMFYAILGIPLTLLCLAHVGQLLANIIRFIYATVCCCRCCRKSYDEEEESDQAEAYDHQTASWHETKAAGIAPASSSADRLPPPRWITDATGKPLPGQPSAVALTGNVDQDGALGGGNDDENDDDADEDEQMAVPFVVPLLAIVFFIVTGAPLFNAWEDWSLLEGCYFCFITISTIGFGDFFPNYANRDGIEAQMEILVSCLYMIFGVATLAMCLQLVQDDVIARIKGALSRVSHRGASRSRDGDDDEA